MSVINTNITSMIGQSNLQKSQSALQTSMERLSSGLRINSAKDDAAGMAISNRFTSNVRGLTQAARNANDGISTLQIIDGGINNISKLLDRAEDLRYTLAKKGCQRHLDRHPEQDHDDRAREPEGAAQPVEVEAQHEVGDQPRVAEAQPDGADAPARILH